MSNKHFEILENPNTSNHLVFQKK